MTNIYQASSFLTPNSANYEQSRALMATSVHYYGEFELALTNSVAFKNGYKPQSPFVAQIGTPPPENSEVAIVRRPVFIEHFSANEKGIHPNYAGNFTLYTWIESSRS
jgi:hypothetical protein